MMCHWELFVMWRIRRRGTDRNMYYALRKQIKLFTTTSRGSFAVLSILNHDLNILVASELLWIACCFVVVLNIPTFLQGQRPHWGICKC